MTRALEAALGLAFLLPASAFGASADLSVSQSASAEIVNPGKEVAFTITVTNHGPDRAPSVSVTDTLAPMVDFVGASSGQGPCGRKSRQVICSAGGIDAGGHATVVVRVKPTRAGKFANRVRVESLVPDSKPANNSSSEATTVRTPTPPPKCAGRPSTIVGTGGADLLEGTDGADVIAALGGDDSVTGLKGNDFVCGSGGNDLLRGKGGNDVLKGGGGNDEIKGGGGSDTLFGKGGDDRLRGGSDPDSLRGGGGSDRCRGGGGSDSSRSC
jgi:uncharacterized repeat protein (TIGR01451 family)